MVPAAHKYQPMKAFASVLATFLAATALQAGSFGGPPPFTNGSPLPTGVDGAYQANVRAENTNGVIRFAYVNGSQSSSTTANTYVIFSEGLVFSGPVAANINLSTIAGVLERDTERAFVNTAMTGQFTAKIDPKSPVYYFKGNGTLDAFIQDNASLPSIVFQSLFSKDFKIEGLRNSQTSS